MARPLLTQMREALWEAIDQWPELRGQFKAKFRADQLHQLFADGFAPALGQLPAIAILPESAGTGWDTNQGQRIQYGLHVFVWVRGLDAEPGERIWQQFHRAVWQAKPTGSTQTYIDRVAEEITVAGPAAVLIPEAGTRPAMTRWEWPITLSARWNPRLDIAPLTGA